MLPVIDILEGVSVSTYFLFISVAFSVSLIWGFFRCPQYGVDPTRFLDLSLILMVGGFLGARLFHAVWEFPDHYLENPADFFKVWQGGFVFYGGVIGAVIPGLIFWKKSGGDLGAVLDVLTPVVPLGYAIGRFATLLSGSGYGLPTSLPWALQYPLGSEAPAGIPLHPTPIYAMVWSVGVMFALLWMEKKIHSPRLWERPGAKFFLLMILHGMGRIVIEQFRNDYRGADLLGFTISTWMSLGLVAWGLLLLWKFRLPPASAH